MVSAFSFEFIFIFSNYVIFCIIGCLDPISSIRIKVKGIEKIRDESQEKIQMVADKIEKQTGLVTDITLGSSPQPVLINVPKQGDTPALGWFEQSWIKIGASIAILKETQLGFSGIITCIVIVAMIYVFSTSLVSFLSRKQEFAVLLAVGWKPKQIKKLLIIESLLIGTAVAVLTLSIQIIFNYIKPDSISIVKILLITFFILFIYLIGPLGTARLVSNIKPIHIMRAGEISVNGARFVRTKGLLSMISNNVMARWQRNIISVIAIALPTSLLILFIYVTFRLNGVLFTTWLGQYVSMEVGLPHYTAVGVSLVISILTTSEILWQNIKERKREIALLMALGWRNTFVRSMILMEGALIGLLGGIMGGFLSIAIIYFMYGTLPLSEIWIVLASSLLPVIIGIMGAWFPSRMAMRIHPIEGVKQASG